MRACHLQSMGFGEVNDFLIIFLRRTELRGELIRREPLMKARCGRIIKLFEQIGQISLIAQGQGDRQIQVGAGQ